MYIEKPTSRNRPLVEVDSFQTYEMILTDTKSKDGEQYNLSCVLNTFLKLVSFTHCKRKSATNNHKRDVIYIINEILLTQ